MRSKNRSEIADFLKLYLVFESCMLKLPLDEFMQQVIEGGITAFQIRDKRVDFRKQYENAELIARYLKNTDIPLIVNDRVDLARIINADGVHLGTKDIPLAKAKEFFPEYFYGYSCNSLSDAVFAEKCGADYIGVGPVFNTQTKTDVLNTLPKEDIKKIVDKTSLPSVAIGGINAESINKLKGLGVDGVAVVSAICASEDPYKQTRILRELVEAL